MTSRQTRTGRRNRASSCQATGPAAKPASPPRRGTRCPRTAAASGTSPSSSPCRYLAAATSKSYVHVIGRSISVVAVNPVTTVPTWVQRNGRSVSPHRGVVAEELDEAVLLGRLVAAVLRLDHDLAAEGHSVDGGVHRLRVGVGETEPEHQRGHGGVRLGPSPEHLEGQAAHDGTSTGRDRRRTPPKNASSASCASWPPSKPRHNRRSSPDELVAGVDGDQVALGARRSRVDRSGRGAPRRRAAAWPGRDWPPRSGPRCRGAGATPWPRPGPGRRPPRARASS